LKVAMRSSVGDDVASADWPKAVAVTNAAKTISDLI